MFKAARVKSPTPSLRMQLRQIARRFQSHWNGDATLWEALTHCVAIVLMPFCIGISTAIGLGFLTRFDSQIFSLIFHAGAGGSLAATAWWCKGMFSLSNRLLSNQRLVAAFLAFLIPVPVAWQLLTSWSIEYVHSFKHDLELSAKYTKKLEGWETRPVIVLALPELHRFSVTGDIGWGSARALASAMAQHPEIRLIEIDSYGGFVHEADLLVDLIQKAEMDTLVRGKCISACTELFLAGKRRFVGPNARFGFHQSGFDGRPRNTEWSISEYESSIFYRSKGVSQDFMDAALNTSYYSLWKPDVLDVKLSGFATHWWSDRPSEYD